MVEIEVQEKSMLPYQKTRILVVISMSLTIAAIHFFRFGSYLNGDWYLYYYSYASDILVPFGFYFLLSWKVKATIMFGFSSLTEVMQAFGIHVLGVTFDQLFLKGFVPCWNLDRLDQ